VTQFLLFFLVKNIAKQYQSLYILYLAMNKLYSQAGAAETFQKVSKILALLIKYLHPYQIRIIYQHTHIHMHACTQLLNSIPPLLDHKLLQLLDNTFSPAAYASTMNIYHVYVSQNNNYIHTVPNLINLPPCLHHRSLHLEDALFPPEKSAKDKMLRNPLQYIKLLT